MNNDIEVKQVNPRDHDDNIPEVNSKYSNKKSIRTRGHAHLFLILTATLVILLLIRGYLTSTHFTKSYKEFIKHHPGYGLGGKLYKLRRHYFPHMKRGEVYLDYTGAGVYQIKQIKQNFAELKRALYCNTHSLSSCSKQTETAVETVREMILDYFNAPKGTYSVIFTYSATQALRIVGDSFPWSNRSLYLYAKHNHNSVLGIRRLAMDHGVKYQTLPWDYYLYDATPDKTYNAREVMNLYYNTPDDDSITHNLIAFPAECNFSGIKYPLDLIHDFETGDRGTQYNEGMWHVLLDAAAFVPTNKLDLNKYPASFVVMSFYKMFGFPTGIGALLVRNDVAGLMRKHYFAGGSVVMASCDTDFCKLKPRYSEKFEDGTLNFHGIIGIKYGLYAIKEIGIDSISTHVCTLVDRCTERALQLRHANGKPMTVIYGEHLSNDTDCKHRGGVFSFNLLDKNGKYIGYNEIMRDLAQNNFLLRAGCSCNPGACHNYLGLTEEYVIESSEKRASCGDEKDKLYGIPLGAIRLSVGYPTTIQEIDAFWDHIAAKYVNFVEKDDQRSGSTLFG